MKMKLFKRTVAWESYTEAFTKLYWLGDYNRAYAILNKMLAAVNEGIQYRCCDASLIEALYSVCSFYSFEQKFANAENLLEVILNAQLAVLEQNDPAISVTHAKLERLRYIWDCTEHPERVSANDYDRVVCIIEETLEKAC